MLSFILVILLCYLSNYVLLAETDVRKTYACTPNLIDIDSGESFKDTEHCNKDKPCIAKCCRRGEIFVKLKIDKVSRCANSNSVNITWDSKLYKKLNIYMTGIEEQVRKSDKNLLDDYKLVQNKLFEEEKCSKFSTNFCYILEDGTMARDFRKSGGSLSIRKPEYYCTDLVYSEQLNKTIQIVYFMEEVAYEEPFTFYATVSIVSAVFLLLVLIVYCVLPELRVLSGMLLMAYVATLFIENIMTASLISKTTRARCKAMEPILYFTIVSKFFWLNVMSFDIWWTFRGQRYQRAIHRQGILVKFGWYCLYGWGVPLCMTTATLLVDYYQDQITRKDLLPLYENCFNSATSYQYYVVYPTTIITIANLVLFIMTVYNIWLINREINRFKASGGNTKKNKNRFRTYIKLFLLMGISWMFDYALRVYEDINHPLPRWGKIVMSLYISLTGVLLFIMFVVNKTTLRMLCKRFNIRIFQDLKITPSSRSTATKSSTHNESYQHGKSISDSCTEINESEVNNDPRYDITSNHTRPKFLP